MTKWVLMMCKHNRFRSWVAEVLFNKYNKNKEIKAFSRGFELDRKRMYVAANVKKILRRFGIKKVNRIPRKLTKQDLKKADLIINLASEVKLSKNLVEKKDFRNWRISDTSSHDYPGILKRIRVIRKKIISLIRELGE